LAEGIDTAEIEEVRKVCAGIDFTKEKDSFADSTISSIESQRLGKGKLKAAIDDER
jgi:hypothetical protein